MRQVTQTDQKDIPLHRASFPVYKLGELPGSMADLDLGREVWHRSAHAEQLYCASVVCFLSNYHYLPLLLLLYSSLFSIIKLFLC